MQDSVRRTRSHRKNFCVQRGLGALPSTNRRQEMYVDSHMHCLPHYALLYSHLHPCIIRASELQYIYWKCGMDYMTLKEASEKWSITPQKVNYLCSADRIPGAVKMATIWLIPKDSQKPADRRYKASRVEDGDKE